MLSLSRLLYGWLVEIYYFNEKTRKFREELKGETDELVSRVMKMLGTYGYELRMPFSRALGGGLFELRIKGSNHIRFLYIFYRDSVWILHGFYKKTDRIPAQEILYARKIQNVFLCQYSK